jgi:hypothetical protein
MIIYYIAIALLYCSLWVCFLVFAFHSLHRPTEADLPLSRISGRIGARLSRGPQIFLWTYIFHHPSIVFFNAVVPKSGTKHRSASRNYYRNAPKPNNQLMKFWRMPSSGMWRRGSSLADFSRLKMGWYVPPKRRFTQDLLGATSQKTAFFIVTAVKTSNLTWLNSVRNFSPHKIHKM